MSITDPRALSILDWLNHKLKLDVFKFEPASSDASFRRYFRVNHKKGQNIVMDAPPEKENTEPFIRIAALFKASNVNVPEIYHQDLTQGFLLLEDFGSHCLLDRLNSKNASNYYQSAFDSLYTLQTKTSITESQLPSYDKTLLNQELDLFYNWFLEKHLNLSIPNKIKDRLNDLLIKSALEQPQVCVHRDFHSRNLMVLDNNSLGIIDFQDAVIGSITYDLVSLLRDCYIAWPEQQVYQWVKLYYQQLSQSDLFSADLDTFIRWFDLMGLQRHLKAIGIFSRLHIRDNKSSYLNDIPLTMTYVSQVSSQYPELTEFNVFLTQSILPAFRSLQ
ncbi:MAG: phosphotransferase [Methylococcales bacterium]|nr:phosphotransferase [Methylococcales bacterium]